MRVRIFSHGVPAYFFAYVGMLTVVLFFIFWKKGEPLKWRWGK